MAAPMSLATLVRAARNVSNRVQIDVNRFLGREHIPAVRETLHVETSSVCNLKCRFCAYDKKQTPRVTMKDEMFFDCIEQALGLGFRRFELTPCTGDVFMDRGLFAKLEFLERHPAVAGYEFFTNFTIPDEPAVERLCELPKLRALSVSVYGHDLDSFLAITLANANAYRRLVANLERLLARGDRRRCALGIFVRTTKSASRAAPSELTRVLARFADAGVRVRRSRVDNNWGGYITKEDVRGLGIDIGGDATYKRGVCTLLLTHVQVLATGVVNGCACRDVDATLRIGDLNDTPLRAILSADNPAWVQLIREQQRGEFRPVCRSCDYYKSIYRRRWSRGLRAEAGVTLDEFLRSPGVGKPTCSGSTRSGS
jgi:MoaA/NifB/PqqE/SkfB family radical SAM enzyme